MNATSLPREVIFLILKWNIRMVSLFHGFNQRLVCHEVNDEVLKILFSEGLLDDRCLPARHLCQTCEKNVRPECSSRAVNDKTVHRYIEALIERRQLPESDIRCQDLATIREAVSTIRQEVKNPPQEYDIQLPRAIITLLGARTAWSYLGPHSATCLDRDLALHLRRRSPEFWSVVHASYMNNIALVQNFINDIKPSMLLEDNSNAEQNHVTSYSYSKVTQSKRDIYVDLLTAIITISIRMGYGEIADLLLSRKDIVKAVILGSFGYFNGLDVLDTAFVTTESSNPLIASTAIKVVSRLLRFKSHLSANRSRTRMRAVTHVPLSSGLLFDALKEVMHNAGAYHRSVICSHMLCRAALTDDMELATVVIKLIQTQIQLELPEYLVGTNYNLTEWIPAYEWADEYGVRQNRLLDCLNPMRVALICSSFKILKYLLEIWPTIREHTLKRGPEYNGPDSMENYRIYYSPVYRDPDGRDVIKDIFSIDTRCRVVRDVFIEPHLRLPGYKTRDPASILGLEMLLSHTSLMSGWGSAAVHAAGIVEPETFKIFLKYVDVHRDLPHEVVNSHDLMKSKPVYVSGDSARTIGERALRHAYQLGRTENVRLLLAAGVRPASDLRGPLYSDDDIDAVVNALKMRSVLREYGLLEGEVILKRPYLFTGNACADDTGQRGERMKLVDQETDNHVWKMGQKVGVRQGHMYLAWPEGRLIYEDED